MDAYNNTSNSPYPTSPSPSNPFPPVDTLPPPWIQQFDTSYNCPYYINTESGESSWTHPFERDEYKNMSFSDPAISAGGAAAGQTGTRGMSDFNGGATGGASYDYSNSNAGYAAPATGGGQASSFYTSGSSAAGQAPYSAQGPIPDNADGAVGPNGERGLGKVVAGGVALYMAKKMFDKWQAGKKQSHQPYYSGGQGQHMSSSSFKPSSFLSSGSNKYGHGQQGQQGYYGGQPSYGPPTYGPPGYYSRDAQSGTPSYGATPSPAPYGGEPDYSNSNGYQQSNYSNNSYQQQSTYGAPPAPSGGFGWGDPRY